jgi:hypothetical protein
VDQIVQFLVVRLSLGVIGHGDSVAANRQ